MSLLGSYSFFLLNSAEFLKTLFSFFEYSLILVWFCRLLLGDSDSDSSRIPGNTRYLQTFSKYIEVNENSKFKKM